MYSCLIVEDNPVHYMVLRNQLTKLGFRVTITTNGREALAYLAGNPLPDLLLVDGYMPEMDGISFIKAFRVLPGGDAPLLVFCSSSVDKADADEAVRLGANHHFAKPISQKQFHLIIETLRARGEPAKICKPA